VVQARRGQNKAAGKGWVWGTDFPWVPHEVQSTEVPAVPAPD